jgi:hypothetical protein
MVLGSIVNWVVFRTLDLTVYTAWWITKTTASGVYYAGKYLIPLNQSPYQTKNNNKNNKNNNEEIEMTELNDILYHNNGIDYIKKQNELLKEQNSILKNQFVPLDM